MSTLAEQIDEKMSTNPEEYAALILRCLTSNQVSEADFAALSKLGKTPQNLKGALSIEQQYRAMVDHSAQADEENARFEKLTVEQQEKSVVLQKAQRQYDEVTNRVDVSRRTYQRHVGAADNLQKSISIRLRQLSISPDDFHRVMAKYDKARKS